MSVELPPYTVLCNSMKAAILGEPTESPVTPATFADGVAAMKVMDAIRASAAAGGKLVELD